MSGDAEHAGIYRHGQVELNASCDWPQGARVLVRLASDSSQTDILDWGDVIIAGFGLAGRCVADFVQPAARRCVVVERNPVTVATQRALGRNVVEGDISEKAVLLEAGIRDASVLALTIPDEAAVLRATELARSLNSEIYIIVRTTYASCGMKAAQLGADDVVKSEQAVAMQFYEKLRHRLTGPKPLPR